MTAAIRLPARTTVGPQGPSCRKDPRASGRKTGTIFLQIPREAEGRRKAADEVRLKAEGSAGDAIATKPGIGRASVFRVLRNAA